MNYHKIDHDNMLNGDGLRVVLFVSGCTHHCKGCQNPQTWDTNSGEEFDKSAYNELISYLDHDYIDGLTLSGGDPLCSTNVKDIIKLCKDIKSSYKNKTIWLYTGYTIEEIFNNEILREVMKYIDVLVDGKYVENLREPAYPWAGSTNQRIIDVNKTIEQKEIILYKN